MDKADHFLADFKSMIAGNHCGLRESDQYDGEEEFIGTKYYLTFPDGSMLEADELTKVIEAMAVPYK